MNSRPPYSSAGSQLRIGDSGLEYESARRDSGVRFRRRRIAEFSRRSPSKVIEDEEAAGGDQSIYGFATNDTIDPGRGRQ